MDGKPYGSATIEQGDPPMLRRDALKVLASSAGALMLPPAATADDRARLERSEPLSWRSGTENLSLATFRQEGPGDVVLFIHGATFPTAMSVAWKMQGVSWMDDLQAGGFDAWSFDMAGYGASDRPACFSADAKASAPFGDAMAAHEQILIVAQHIRALRPKSAIHLLAHSWGTVPARLAAVARPDLISRLVLFGPVETRPPSGKGHQFPSTAWFLMGAAEQRPRQRTGLPDGEPTPVPPEEIERWCAAYLETDASSGARSPASVKVPGGPIADLGHLWSGGSIVDNGKVLQPTLIVRGEWDDVTADVDAGNLFETLGAKNKRDVKISGGNHWLHLQPRRRVLWATTAAFLKEAGK